MKLLLVGLAVLLLNIPFGYWRDNVRKFSIQWVLAIHAPIPAVVAIRIFSQVGFHWTTYPVMLICYFAGQFIGARIHKLWAQTSQGNLSSCLFMDSLRRFQKSV